MTISWPTVEKSNPRPGKYPNLNTENVGTHWRSEGESAFTDAVKGAGPTRSTRCLSSSASLRRNCSTPGGRDGTAGNLASEPPCFDRTALSDPGDAERAGPFRFARSVGR